MLYRFTIELSNIDQGVYETLDFRVSQHPSEIATYLLTRTLAFALSYQEGLEFSAGGLSDPDSPALQKLGQYNAIETWIEIGNPSSRKLHKATKSAKKVVVYTYKNAEVLMTDLKAHDIHRADEIQIFYFNEKFMMSLEKLLEKNNKWSLVLQQNQLSLSAREQTIETELREYKLT